MPLACPYLEGPGSYERVMHGWVDAPGAETLLITVRIVDPWVSVELVAETTPSPGYQIRAGRGRVLVGPAARVDPALAEAVTGLAGLAMTAGFTRGVAAVTGERPGAGYFVDAAIEVARLSRQVTRLPREIVDRHWAEGTIGVWRLDMQGWTDLPGSCYTYRPETAALFAERTVATPMSLGLYCPLPGATRVFNRTKVARVEAAPDGWRLGHSMFDEAHAFLVSYRVDPAGAGGPTIVDATVTSPRLPYVGICGDPQARIRGLVGERVDPGLRRRLGELIGGPTGCAQLYDLTADLLKLLAA